MNTVAYVHSRRIFCGFAALTLVTMLAATAQAQRLFTPVYVKQTTAACKQLASLQYRDRLISQQRTEALSGVNTLSAFGTGDCTNVSEGEWLFFDGVNGNYVCLRPRPGADCLWIRRAAVGEIVEVMPLQKPGQAKAPPCVAWSPIVQKSLIAEKDLMAKWRASQGPSNLGTDLMRGVVTGALGVVMGGPTSRQVDAANACVMRFAKSQEIGRRLYAYSFCPTLVGPEQSQRDSAEYNAVMLSIREFCLRNSANP